MLKLSICILVVLLAVVWSLPTSENQHDGEDGYCHVYGLSIKEGETVPAPIGMCKKITCRKARGKDVAISALTCAAWQLEPGSKCHKSEIDLTKQYPACCPHKVCDEE